MAEKTATGSNAATADSATNKAIADRLAAGRANRKQLHLSDKQLFVRQTARTAIKAAKLVIQRVERGDDVSAEAIEACTQLAGKTAILLIGD